MTVVFTRDSEHEALSKLPRQGRWGWHDGQIVYRCKCMNAPLLNSHTIEQDGSVHPSVVCVIPRCGFHEFVKLEGWTTSDDDTKQRKQFAPNGGAK